MGNVESVPEPAGPVEGGAAGLSEADGPIESNDASDLNAAAKGIPPCVTSHHYSTILPCHHRQVVRQVEIVDIITATYHNRTQSNTGDSQLKEQLDSMNNLTGGNLLASVGKSRHGTDWKDEHKEVHEDELDAHEEEVGVAAHLSRYKPTTRRPNDWMTATIIKSGYATTIGNTPMATPYYPPLFTRTTRLASQLDNTPGGGSRH